MKNFKILVLSFLFLGLISGCGKHSLPKFVYMPDMAYSPALKYQEAGMKPPVPGTVPQGHFPMAAGMEMEEAGRTMKNPLKRTSAVLARGKQMFNTYCMACHGPYGEGDGSVVPKFPRPPSLQSDKIKGFPDGNIYFVITHGQNLMPSYASQVPQADRWAIIHYIRAMQKAKNPSAEDLKAAEAE
jgi:mono/diheme cytochrome c family protein